MEIVVTFLAILDLVRDGSCKLIQEKYLVILNCKKIDFYKIDENKRNRSNN